jgi:hypothetical protein
MHRLFDTHPPIAERIAVLEHMQQGLSVWTTHDYRRSR